MPYLYPKTITVEEETFRTLEKFRSDGMTWNEFMKKVIRIIRKMKSKSSLPIQKVNQNKYNQVQYYKKKESGQERVQSAPSNDLVL